LVLPMTQGDRSGAIAEWFDISAARISQLRQELREDWEAFTA
jgi:hypothetical protein